ncbi:MAG: hypothetical protein EOO28_36505, partial [Comamonadaceae bacterium]
MHPIPPGTRLASVEQPKPTGTTIHRPRRAAGPKPEAAPAETIKAESPRVDAVVVHLPGSFRISFGADGAPLHQRAGTAAASEPRASVSDPDATVQAQAAATAAAGHVSLPTSFALPAGFAMQAPLDAPEPVTLRDLGVVPRAETRSVPLARVEAAFRTSVKEAFNGIAWKLPAVERRGINNIVQLGCELIAAQQALGPLTHASEDACLRGQMKAALEDALDEHLM